MNKTDLVAHIGEVKIGRNDDVLHALLGSCVGIGILWRQKGVYGLSHCLLPKAPKPSFEITGRFVDRAIPSILALMKAKEDDYKELRAVIAGGGNMTKPGEDEDKTLIGNMNVRMAQERFKELGIKIWHEDTGGELGRTITIFCSSGKYEIQKIPRPAAVA